MVRAGPGEGLSTVLAAVAEEAARAAQGGGAASRVIGFSRRGEGTVSSELFLLTEATAGSEGPNVTNSSYGEGAGASVVPRWEDVGLALVRAAQRRGEHIVLVLDELGDAAVARLLRGARVAGGGPGPSGAGGEGRDARPVESWGVRIVAGLTVEDGAGDGAGGRVAQVARECSGSGADAGADGLVVLATALPPLSFLQRVALLHRHLGGRPVSGAPSPRPGPLAGRLSAESAAALARSCPGRGAAEYLSVSAAWLHELSLYMEPDDAVLTLEPSLSELYQECVLPWLEQCHDGAERSAAGTTRRVFEALLSCAGPSGIPTVPPPPSLPY